MAEEKKEKKEKKKIKSDTCKVWTSNVKLELSVMYRKCV